MFLQWLLSGMVPPTPRQGRVWNSFDCDDLFFGGVGGVGAWGCYCRLVGGGQGSC